MFIVWILLFSTFYSGLPCSPCKIRTYDDDNIVCVCDESYCDDLILLSNVAPNQAAAYETNAAGARFQSSILNFSKSFNSAIENDVPLLSINRSEQYQFILGFGGAFTDAAGINIHSVTPALQSKIINSYFSKNGLQYNMGRIPIASCDFSTHPYSYDDVEGDFNLTHFRLTKEDMTLKIPVIQKAMGVAEDPLLLFGSPWSAPAWMKTNGAMSGQGALKGNPGEQYYKTWANYLVRFLEEYRANNISMWGLTLQNEPTDGAVLNFPFQAMYFSPQMQRDFLKMDIGPALTKAGFTPDKLRVMIGDDDRVILPKWADVVLADPDAARYVSGVAFHWYFEGLFPHKILDITHSKHPEMFFLASEACTGAYPWEFPKVALGNWKRAERYAYDIIQDLLHWSIGWIDWNLALDMQGGPNWVSNFVDAPIIVNVGTNEFYKQPMFYALAHFSKCLPRGSYRIGLQIPSSIANLGSDFSVAAFQTPQNTVVLIAVNRMNKNLLLKIQDSTKGYLNINVTAHSVQSYIW